MDMAGFACLTNEEGPLGKESDVYALTLPAAGVEQRWGTGSPAGFWLTLLHSSLGSSTGTGVTWA